MLSGSRSGGKLMAKAVQNVVLFLSRDISRNKLVLSQSNVWCITAGVLVEELAEHIARRALQKSLNVQRAFDGNGVESSTFEILADDGSLAENM
jgi:ParB family chromosome partitioning protein